MFQDNKENIIYYADYADIPEYSEIDNEQLLIK